MARSICRLNQVSMEAVMNEDDTTYWSPIGIAATRNSARANLRFRCEPSTPERRSKMSFTKLLEIR